VETPVIGNSAEIQRIRDLIAHVAKTDLNIVISGESGVGKELVAHNLYRNSNRTGKPFVKINCAALPEGLLESELFGFERGAFTGADQKKRGRIEMAHGGVLLLDEIGDMSMGLQAKLLHVLQSGDFSPLGSEKDIKVNIWFICATNHNLEEDIKEKRFREDLYYRLNVIRIHIPALRERPEDIEPLVAYYLEKYAQRFGEKLKITRPEMEKFKAYSWPGNVRELQNVIKRMMVLGSCDDVLGQLNGVCLPRAAVNSRSPAAVLAGDLFDPSEMESENMASISLKNIRKKALDRVEREVISTVLDKTGWNRLTASKILKISYKTLLYKIDDLNLEPPMHSNAQAR